MGINQSKTTTENIVKFAIKATLNVSLSRSITSHNQQTGNFSGNVNTNADGVDMKQTITISLKSSNSFDATTGFSSTIENKLKEAINQKVAVGSVSVNNVETINRSVTDFAVDCSRVLSESLSMVLASDQTINLTNNTNSSFRNIRMAQTVEGAIDAITDMITRDTNVQSSKAILDKTLDQTAEGFAGVITAYGKAVAAVFASASGPMLILLIAILVLIGPFVYLCSKILGTALNIFG